MLEKRNPFVKFTTEPKGLPRESFEIMIPNDCENVKARLIYLTEPFAYSKKGEMVNVTHTKDVPVNDRTIVMDIPQEAKIYYFEFTIRVKGKKLVSTTSLIT